MGGGVVAEIFRDPCSVGGGGSSRKFPVRDPYSVGWLNFFSQLTAVTDPKFVFWNNRP